MKNAHQLLRDARERYAAHPSHVRYGMFPPEPTECPIVALERAWSESHDVEDPRRTFRDALVALYAASEWEPTRRYVDLSRRVEIMEWNAESSTEDVLAAFDIAIERTS